MPYRGATNEEFNSDYWFARSVPATTAEWDTLRNAVVFTEQAIYDGAVKWVRVIGYSSSEPGAAAVYRHDYTPGTEPTGSFVGLGTENVGAGDQAACVEWLTDLASTKGKPVYLRKYVHRPYCLNSAPDSLGADYIQKLTVYSEQFIAGGSVGQLRSPNFARYALSPHVVPYVTTRTLKRRGKRKRPV